MAGITPIEGQQLIAKLLYSRVLVDRDEDLELGLFTNATVGETTTLADIDEPALGGYARKTLSDASWDITAGEAGYAALSFTAVGGAFVDVMGYFIATKSASGSPRLLHLEVDPDGPFTVDAANTYSVTLSIDPV